MHKQPSRLVIMFGGLTGAAIALLGILLGGSVARLTSSDHPPAHERSSEDAH
jgi:hypothetical protein